MTAKGVEVHIFVKEPSRRDRYRLRLRWLLAEARGFYERGACEVEYWVRCARDAMRGNR